MNTACGDGPILLDDIPFAVDQAKVVRDLKISVESPDFESLKEMLADAAKEGSPKAVYRECRPCEKSENSVLIGGEVFESRILRINLERAQRVFLYVVTCGRELEAWSKRYSDPLYSYFADYIKQAVLSTALKYFCVFIGEKYRLKKYSKMIPGALEDWPLSQQTRLFEALGDVNGMAGVELTDNCLMIPSKSVSGMLFPTETSFESCTLCPRVKCEGRRAPYDEGLCREKYRLSRPETKDGGF